MLTPDSAHWLIVLWLTVIGGAVGSFLNVVVYRLPRGISIVHPPSHCPNCGKPIRWYDNVPVFGWIMLRGRCRQCGNPISVRYPVVEAITAAIFGLLAAVEMDRLGTTYPMHVLLLCTLLCAGLIEYDGHRPPWRLFLPALAVGALAQMFWPVPAHGATEPWDMAMWPTGTFYRMVSVVLLLVLLSIDLRRSTAIFRGLLCVLACLGLGPLLVLTIVIVMIEALLWLLRHVLPRLRISPNMSLGAITLVWILAWARLVSG